jgi:quercetin dioxygenase-like cupin family protein
MRRMLVLVMLGWALFGFLSPAIGQRSEFNGRIGQLGCRPVRERTTETGCWIMANMPLRKLPAGSVFWHLDLYPSQAEAEQAKAQNSAVIEAHGKTWLLTIERAGWRPAGGERVAEIGPLPIDSSAEYTARYMEATFTPGMTSSIHRHPGPEVWWTLAGETCLETSEGKMVGRPGTPVIVPGGLPMYLTATGTDMRRAVVLILYESSKPAATPANDWAPKGLCGKP